MDTIEILNKIVELSNPEQPFSINPDPNFPGYHLMKVGDIGFSFYGHFTPLSLIDALAHFKAYIGVREGWIDVPQKAR
jgi:hypothetical protein